MAEIPGIPTIYTVRDVLAHLKGKIGRNNLLDHLKANPHHGDGPTHRWMGNKIVFFNEDLQRLMESLARPKVPRMSSPATLAEPSEEAKYQKVLKLLQQTKGKRRL